MKQYAVLSSYTGLKAEIMQINRIFGITYLLLNHEHMTAKMLSEKFNVSIRTIYRDIDRMSQLGIPIYTERGKRGGVSLLSDFVLSKVLLDTDERKSILQALQTTRAINFDPKNEETLAKLTALFGIQDPPWLAIDFSTWYGFSTHDFEQLKTAILSQKVVTFNYHNSKGEMNFRTVEPTQLIFKSMGWYLKAYCLNKQEVRMFKLSRITKLETTEQSVENRPSDVQVVNSLKPQTPEMIHLKMLVSLQLGYRIYDDFPIDTIQKYSDKTLLIEGMFPKTEWLYSYILSLGQAVKVIEPFALKQELLTMIKKMEENYNE
ncbi:MAG: YafY family protein [Lactococcus chungangensis]